jgi:hypothetical protein
MTRPDIHLLLPQRLDRYTGPRLALWALAAYNVVGTVRSLIHVFAPDSGASSIAGMDVTVAGGANAIALLAQWGGAQLLAALLIWIVLARYPGFVPLMIAESLADNIGRVLIGQGKALVTVHTPPGAVSWLLVPALAVLLVVALMPTRDAEGDA